MKDVMKDQWKFHDKFARSRPLLYHVADIVLDDPEDAERAIQSCYRTASASPRRSQCGNAFHSWILRVMIDEALLIVNQRVNPSTVCEEAA